MKTSINRPALCETISAAARLAAPLRTQVEGRGVFFAFKEKTLDVYGVGELSFFRKTLKMTEPLFESETCLSLDHKKLSDFLQGFSTEAVCITPASGGLVVSLDKTSARFSVSPPVPRPQLGLEAQPLVSFDPKIVSENIKNLLFCTSGDSSRPTLSSIKFIPQGENRVLMVATDGFRLSLVQTSFSAPLPEPLQVPAAFLRDVFGGVLSPSERVRLSSHIEGRVSFEQEGGVVVGTRLVAGDFPPYERVLLKTFQHNLIFSKDEVARATKSMSVFAREFSNIIVFEVSPEGCVIRPKKEAGLENRSEVSFEGAGLTQNSRVSIAFNYHYVLDYLSSIQDEHFTVRINKPEAPALFLPGKVDEAESHEGALYQHIIMPVRIQE